MSIRPFGNAAAVSPAPSPSIALPDDRYRVGTLEYTRAGLITLFVWLLWGDFCFTFMERVIPSVLPLKLKALGTSNWTIGLLVSTIPNVMNFTICPIVSFRSDRYRSRWGRRIPFLLFATPFVTLFLILMGFSEEIAGAVHALTAKWLPTMTPTTLTLVLIGLLMVCFQFFNMFTASVYYYLFNDVVPRAYLSRFMALFRAVGTVVGSLYNFFIYRYAQTHMSQIFLGAALLYFVAFMLLCLKVKEGEYPPPLENLDRRKGFVSAARTYFTECFTHRFWWYFFLSNAFWSMAGCISTFGVFLWLSLGVGLDQQGKIGGVVEMLTVLLLYPAGMLADRIHPIRVMLLAKLIVTIEMPLRLIFLFYDPTPRTAFFLMIGFSAIGLPLNALLKAASMPMTFLLLPKDRFGQFGSANAMFTSVAVIAGGLLAGAFLDVVQRWYRHDLFYYRFIPCWTIFFEGLSLVFLFLLYRSWKRHSEESNVVESAAPSIPTTSDNGGQQA